VALLVFKTSVLAPRGVAGGFDSHALPPFSAHGSQAVLADESLPPGLPFAAWYRKRPQTSPRKDRLADARAFKLFEKRRANVAKALERIIEHAGEVEVTAPAVVSAAQPLSKIDAQGRWIDRVETVSLGALFEKMMPDELERYAREEVLPDWFQAATGPEGSDPS
jgi:hypothetical protein